MKVGLIGAGAVGSVIAQRLYTCCTFFLIADRKRKAYYQEGGIYINDEPYFFPCRTREEAISADIIILAVKNYQLANAMDEIAPFVGENTILISLLNGVESEEKLELRFPFAKTLYAFIKGVSSNKEFNRITYFSSGTVVFGENDNKISESVKTVQALFEKAGIDYEIPQNILHEMWWKFMLNCCFNTISAILLTPYSKICTNESFFRASRMACSEILKVAKSEGVDLNGEDVNKLIFVMQQFSDDGKTSMLQDMEAGRKSENDFFCGTVIRLGKKHRIETPVCSFLYQLLEAASYARS